MPLRSKRPAAQAKRKAHDSETDFHRIAAALLHPSTAATRPPKHEELTAQRPAAFGQRWCWVVGFWIWLLAVHAVGIGFFTSGFLLTRLVLDQRSGCSAPPVDLGLASSSHDGLGPEIGCWHPKSFERAVVLVIDALRYDFTVPVPQADAHHFHNAFPFLYDSAAADPTHAFLRPFIADPPTTTLQRLKGLTTGTLPTFVDMGSNFAGTAIDEDNLLTQLRDSGRRIAQVGDDTWWALFPGHFEPAISRAYDSFNVWDLHTVDNGVIEHLTPLLHPSRSGEWDLLVGHCLGVDHAGHRYGPDHPAMEAKLRQMDQLVRNLTAALDNETLLVVMGDHGMDAKGDHGGESDDEVQSAIWMYSSRPFFGRTDPDLLAAAPPAKASIRPVAQIDLVPTIALLLGIPIPFNNLGRPIEEAFIGSQGDGWAKLAAASRVTAAGIMRYQQAYFTARGLSLDAGLIELWNRAQRLFGNSLQQPPPQRRHQEIHEAYVSFQQETLRICKAMWARFDVGKMTTGTVVMVVGLVALILYASEKGDEAEKDGYDIDQPHDTDHTAMETATAAAAGAAVREQAHQILHQHLLSGAAVGALPGIVVGVGLHLATGAEWVVVAATAAVTSGLGVITVRMWPSGARLKTQWWWWVPSSGWGWLVVVVTGSQAIGFASNSYTIWEDSISLFFLATFGAAHFVTGMGLGSHVDRALAVRHAIAFMLLGRLASLSRLCREEQMPFCRSTYYASATSSTSASWQVLIPFVVCVGLPFVVGRFLAGPDPEEQGSSRTQAWVAYGFRAVMFAAAVAWLLDAVDNASSYDLQSVRVAVVQLALVAAVPVGAVMCAWMRAPYGQPAASPRLRFTALLGCANVHEGVRYLPLALSMVAVCILLTKPVGLGALALMLWQLLSLAELAAVNSAAARAAAPAVLALLGNFYFFKTGHQAALSSIQWDAAFVPLSDVRHPWSGLAVAANTFAGQLVAVVAVPLLVLWQSGRYRRRRPAAAALEAAARALAGFVAVFAVQALATMAWAAWLRRHLMLYRVFGPRFMMAAVLLLLLDAVGLVVALGGVWASMVSSVGKRAARAD